MVADYFTKALQGTAFRYMRDMIMGNIPIPLPPTNTDDDTHATNGGTAPTAAQAPRSVLKNETNHAGASSILRVSSALPTGKIPTRKLRTDGKTMTWAAIVTNGQSNSQDPVIKTIG